MTSWTDGFFDSDYLKVWGAMNPPETSDAQAAALVEICGIAPGTRVLDAPCGYGRIGRRLAEAGAVVTGLDLSADLLAHAERQRGELPAGQLTYRQQDLREPFAEQGFEVVLNLFSSIGYGEEEEDEAIVAHLAAALAPGGRLFLDTQHRDTIVAMISRGNRPAFRTPDGTLVQEEPVWDPVAGAIETTWYWSGPSGSGERKARLRIYSLTELVRLLEGAGLLIDALHAGCSTTRYEASGPAMGGRVGILASMRG